MAMPDKKFDRWITEALNAEIGCSRPQKHAVWKQVAQKANLQTMLAATDPEILSSYHYVSLMATGRRLWNWFTTLAGEETRYDRARLNRNRFYYLSALGDGSISVHIHEPLHYRWLSPT